MQLQELKKTLESHRHDLQVQKLLLEEREIAETQNLKKRVKEIDTHLDQIGEESEEIIAKLEKQLITHIHQQFPISKVEYDQITEKLEKAKKRQTDLLQQRLLVTPFLKLLQEGAAIPQKGKLLSLIFGKHPIADLAQLIKRAMILSERIFPQIEEPPIKAFLSKFLSETNQTWNHALYKGRFTELSTEFNDLMIHTETEIGALQHVICIEEQLLSRWIDKFSSNLTPRTPSSTEIDKNEPLGETRCSRC